MNQKMEDLSLFLLLSVTLPLKQKLNKTKKSSDSYFELWFFPLGEILLLLLLLSSIWNGQLNVKCVSINLYKVLEELQICWGWEIFIDVSIRAPYIIYQSVLVHLLSMHQTPGHLQGHTVWLTAHKFNQTQWVSCFLCQIAPWLLTLTDKKPPSLIHIIFEGLRHHLWELLFAAFLICLQILYIP